MASGFSKRAPSRARSDSSDCGGMRSATIQPIVSNRVSGQRRSVRPVIHTISPVLNDVSDAISFLKILRSTCFFTFGEQCPYFFRHISRCQGTGSGRSSEREAKMPIGIENETPLLFRSIILTLERIPEDADSLRGREVVAHRCKEVVTCKRRCFPVF